jgi:DnaK suppressor protein
MSADLAIGAPENAAAAAVRPAPAAPPVAAHLAPDTMPRWRALLESHWRARLERVTELSLAYHEAEDASAGPPPAGAQSGRALLRRAVAQRRALAEIEAALARLSNGRFGRCERCGGVVSATRLTRTPQARYCISCETGAECTGPRQP